MISVFEACPKHAWLSKRNKYYFYRWRQYHYGFVSLQIYLSLVMSKSAQTDTSQLNLLKRNFKNLKANSHESVYTYDIVFFVSRFT